MFKLITGKCNNNDVINNVKYEYSVTDKNTKLPCNAWLEKQFTEYEKGLCYVNADLLKEWIKLTSSQLGDLVTLSLENTISSQGDLVNRRMEYPSRYHSLDQSMAASVYDRAAGAMTSRNDRYTIQLFRRANLSTLAHELMHVVHLDMECLERAGKGTSELSCDLLRKRAAQFPITGDWLSWQKSTFAIKIQRRYPNGRL